MAVWVNGATPSQLLCRKNLEVSITCYGVFFKRNPESKSARQHLKGSARAGGRQQGARSSNKRLYW